jgi:hypothetical protein
MNQADARPRISLLGGFQLKMGASVMHGEDDQVVPVQISAMKAAHVIKDAKDIHYPGAPHGASRLRTKTRST